MADWQHERQALLAYYDRLRGRALALEEELGAALNSLDLVAALVRARRALEVIVIEVCEHDLGRARGTEPLAGLLPKLKETVPESALAAMVYLNQLGNLGAHPKPVTELEVGQAFVALAAVLLWYVVEYRQGFGDPPVGTAPGTAPGAPPAPLAPNPYLGLDTFEEKDAGRFFGRAALLERELLPAFLALAAGPARLLALVGPSGSGKSSVARAGLLPLIKSRLPCRLLTLTPTHRPLDALAQALARHALPEDPAPAGKAAEFRALLGADALGLTRIAALLWAHEQTPLVLLLDQAEEVFSLCQDPAEQGLFLNNLLAAVTDPAPRLALLLTLRSDFLGETQRFPAFNALLTRQGHLVPALDEPGLRLAIAEPARLASRPLDQAVVDLLLAQSLGREGALPLLQYALSEVWRGLAAGRPPEETLRACNGVGGALAGRAQQVYDGLTPEEQRTARRCLLRLVQLGEGGPDTRRRVAIDDLLVEGESRPALLAILRRFTAPDARFLAFGRDAQGREQVEITHDALIAHWGDLRDWLAADRDDLRLLARLDAAARHWEQQGAAAGLLWRRPDLDLLRRYAGREGAALSPLQGRFYRAARRLAGRERLLRGGGLALLLLLTLASLGAAWWARQAEALAERQKLVALDAITQRTYETVDKLAKVAGTSQVLGELIQNNVELLDRLLALDPSDANTQYHQAANLQRAADAWMQLGDTGRAKETMQRLLEITRGRAAADPGDREWQHGLANSHDKLGDFTLALGDTAAAREAYRQALAIGERLAAVDPGNSQWQRGLSVSHSKLGDLALALGDTAAAREAFRQDLSIAERLAAADPGNSQWQRDLSISHDRSGDLALALGDTAAAREAFRQALAIRERLAAADPGNSEWQRDLSVSHEKLGNLALALGDTAAAREAYGKALAIAERLAAADPGNSEWQRDLSVSHQKLGDLALALGDTAAAREEYRQHLAIAERLAAADPGNSEWQRDLSVSHNKLGDLALALGDTAAAREAYRQALAIRERLAAADPGNSRWQRDLLVSYLKMGRVRLAAGETAEALEAADKGVSIAQRLAGADPSNPRRATETAAALKLRGQVHDAQGQLDLATDDYREAAKLAPDDADAQGALGWSLIRLGRFAEARAPTEQAHRLAPTDVNWTIKLGHTYLLAGDPAGARPYYDASIAQIPDAAALARGPVADFELFIAKGWQVKACRAALARMREGFARRAPAKPAGGAGP